MLGESFVLGWWPVFVIGVIVAGLTGFYMFRLMGLTFYGKSHVDPEVEPKIHESPPSMVGPLVLLAIPTIFLGLAIGLPLGDSVIKHWLEPVFHPAEVIMGITFPEYELFGVDGGLIIISVAMAALGIGVGIWLFGVFNSRARLETVDEPDAAQPRQSLPVHRLATTSGTSTTSTTSSSTASAALVANGVMWFDVKIVDGIVNGVGSRDPEVGDGIRHIQTGRVQNYALGIAVGLIVIAAFFILMAR